MLKPKEQVMSAIVRARVELEEALYELEKLPAENLGTFRFATHALNNFLTVTGGTVELLQLSLADHPDRQVTTWLAALEQATSLMAHIVDQMMNASTSKGVPLRFEHVALPIMVQRFLDYYQRIADRKQILCLSGSMVAIPPVWTDRVATAAVLDNLLSNAVKFSLPGKRIWVHLSAEQDGVVCSIRDEGPGLSQEDQGKLFQRGTQLTPQPTGGESSTGYGLAVAKELMERLHGVIWCESILGQGSCFSFRLPCYQEQLHGTGQPLPDPHAAAAKAEK